ncbi:uncharacterized protein LOC128732515 [Sabethes cyaneus]|uniref:uncharacterized protein LOC128732515 n=1 Tax=Sabethes cyaneus TaxID=53552 RepID=UPI00237E4248|nr:uncharacterized protein LOC128732515 [Sabethes cyaneus]
MEAFINEIVEPRIIDLIVLILPKWKLLLYIFLMNVIIFSPIYFFSVILIDRWGELQLICPSAALFGFNLIHRALFVRYNLNNTRSIFLGVVILGAGISASGMVAMYSASNRESFLMVLLLYSLIGGYGYHLIFSKVWKLLAKIFNAKKEMFVIKFLHSFGQSMTLLFLLVTFHCPWKDYIFGALLILFGGVLLNIIPMTILIVSEKKYLKFDQDSMIQITEKGNESFYNDVSKSYVNSDANEQQVIEQDTVQMPMTSWKNPATYSRQEEPEEPINIEDDFDEEILSREGKFFNPDGVEILEIIMEEDEENMAAYEAATANTVLAYKLNEKDQWTFVHQFIESITGLYRSLHIREHFNTKIVNSIRYAFTDMKFYSCLLLKSTDLCIFVLFLTLLPRFMSYHYYYRGKPRQMLLMSFVIISSAWASCSLLLLWCDIKFRKQQDKLLIFSILFKTFGYFCVYSTRSSFWTVSGCLLIGVGHAVSCSYQDLVIKRKFNALKWRLIKSALCLTSGSLVVLLAILVNVAYVYCRIDYVLLAVLLVYCFSGSLWLVCNYKIIFR